MDRRLGFVTTRTTAAPNMSHEEAPGKLTLQTEQVLSPGSQLRSMRCDWSVLSHRVKRRACSQAQDRPTEFEGFYWGTGFPANQSSAAHDRSMTSGARVRPKRSLKKVQLVRDAPRRNQFFREPCRDLRRVAPRSHRRTRRTHRVLRSP